MDDDYGLTPEQREAIDGLIPGWEDLPPEEISKRAAEIVRDAISDLEEAKGLADLIKALEGNQ